MKLASIEVIKEILPHPNADRIVLAKVLGFTCIVAKDAFKVGDRVVFIQPDTVLPDAEWAMPFKAKSNRVKAIRLKNIWSEGLILSFNELGIVSTFSEGSDISEIIGVTKYEAPIPQELNAKGGLPYGIVIADEERYNNLNEIPYGEIVNVTRKADGKSWSAYCVLDDNGEWKTGILGRRFEYDVEKNNNYTIHRNILPNLLEYCKHNNVSLCLRGECVGAGIQSYKKNFDAQGEKKILIYSCWLIKEQKYAGLGTEFYYENVANAIGVPTVETLEREVILTPELIKKYAEDLIEINGKPFEGVVIKGRNFSFKIINKNYDSLK